MKFYQADAIRNVVLVGSSKSGKTTLAECMMFEGGVISRMGTVEAGNTVSDYHEIEQARKTSVFSSVLHTEWRGTKINLIDTPGLDDFIGELIGALRVSDTALLTLNAHYGVEVGTEIAWRYLKKFKKPTIFVVNQMDHPQADFNQTVESARQQFGNGVVVMQYPYNSGEGFDSIIDLLKMVMYKFPIEGGKPEKLPIPEEELERAKELHNTLVEAAAEHDDSLMEHYFEQGELDEDEMRKGLRLGMLNRSLFPVFCVSAKNNMGSGRLMGFLGNVAPCAGDMAPEHTTNGGEIKIDDSDTTLFVFKATNEKHAGSMSYFKVCSGEVEAGMELHNTSAGTKGKLNQLFGIDGKNRHAVNKLAAGDIGATVKFKDTHVNHTLRSAHDSKELVPIEFPEPKIRTAIISTKQGDDEKLAQALHKIMDSDPTVIMEYAKELKQTLLHAQGELHLQTIKWTLEHVYGVEVEFQDPKIAYRESIQSSADASYKHKKQSGGAGQFAEVSIKIQPYSAMMEHPSDVRVRHEDLHELPWGGTLAMYNCIVGGVIDNRFMPAILKGVMEVMEHGPLTGSCCRDVAVYVVDGKMHAVDSNEISFKIAGSHAFKDAFMLAKPKLMEPIYRLEVLVPEAHMGDVMTDLQGRRAVVEGFEAEGVYQRITARVPLAELGKYASTLRALSQGRATHSRKFLQYDQVPGDVQNKLIAKQQAKATA
ncbi:elongation factor G [Pontibacter sp. G13]|uniref:elongation factor G n=1 Tax=Pontibacter sp. G13 TaxID=3074898 RepID=UPI00288B6F8E|nr:elongation factor G [Pontibacter sp. G13]WNJ16347.1 elongation factor G [Pontibacter sp. G13]